MSTPAYDYDDRYGPPNPVTRFLDTGSAANHVRWLWPPRIPLGTLTLLIGDPAVGKPPCATALEQCRPPTNPAPHLEWDNPTNPDWRLSTGDLDLSPESFSLLSEACDWLTGFLAPGPRPAREVLTAARDAGLASITVRRAKRLLAVRSVKPAADVPWSWAAREGLDNKGDQISRAQTGAT